MMVVRRVLTSRPVRDYTLMTLGLALTAWGLDAFLIPNKIAAGGVSGLATIVYHVVAGQRRHLAERRVAGLRHERCSAG